MHLSLGFSPCPNDTFIFDALVNNKIDTEGLNFDVVLEDVQALNTGALKNNLDITKISYAALPLVTKEYVLLNSGSALGSGVGPLLISNKEHGLKNIELTPVAIPGTNTTAHLLFSWAYPKAKNKIFLRYDEIENFVLQNKGLGVIIHENRFTYEDKGLLKIMDLGEYWELKTGHPIPLGGIAVKRNINHELQCTIDRLIKKSIEYAFSNYPVLNDYIRSHAQEMNEEVMRKHIELYVNDYSINLGEKGRDALKKLIAIYNDLNGVEIPLDNLFVSPD